MCEKCKRLTQRDELYRQVKIKTDSIESIKRYLWGMLDEVIENEGIYDHGWDPDLEIAIYRYSLLYPNDSELRQLKQIYTDAINNPRKFLKFEPAIGTTIITPDMIPRKSVLKKVYLPDGLREISSYTFSDCRRLTDLYIPDSVTEIGTYAFKGCVNLETIHLPSELVKISEGLFQGCNSLKKVFLSDTIEEIGNYAFKGCTRLAEPWIPKNLMRVGIEAFDNPTWKISKIQIKSELL
jgi:hypothetical protein